MAPHNEGEWIGPHRRPDGPSGRWSAEAPTDLTVGDHLTPAQGAEDLPDIILEWGSRFPASGSESNTAPVEVPIELPCGVAQYPAGTLRQMIKGKRSVTFDGDPVKCGGRAGQLDSADG